MTDSHPTHDDRRIITALDLDDPGQALALAERLDPELTRLKIGKQLFTLAGPAFVERLQQRGYDVFLDLKFHDIPNTVAGAVAAAASLGVWMVNIHASGGPRMMAAARDAIERMNPSASDTGGTRLIGVTVLTSHDAEELAAIGIDESPAARVERLVKLCMTAGLDGVVCSAEECERLRAVVPANFLLVTPGIRPAGAVRGDQRRVVTPTDAIAAGSDHLVVGRPIVNAEDPAAALQAIATEVSVAIAGRARRQRDVS
jgi:orotidine-5'-phosphate decarboxylase